MFPPEYTTCVAPEDYEDPPLPEEGSTVATLEGLFTSLSLLGDTCDYMLHGKLVCLGDPQCAIGHVAGFETVADKKFPDTIDNDFSINLLLAPWDLASFAAQHRRDLGYALVANDPPPTQGFLIKEQPNMPEPREADEYSWGLTDPATGDKIKHSRNYGGTFETFPDRGWIDYNPPAGIRGVPYDVPVLHCEIEGERAHQVCDMLDALSYPFPGMKKFCKANWFTKAICKIVQWFMTPAIAPALAAAWAKGSSDNRDYMGGGSLQRGDFVAISGRWCYDAGHIGYNEIHPVRYIQRLPEDSADPADFDEWCQRINEVPPGDTGTSANPLTVDQQIVSDEQRKPRSRWVFHPLVDGCARKEEEPEPEWPVPR
jgi:hypothetical protein